MGQQGGMLGLRGTVGGLVFAKDGTVRQKPASNKAAFASKASMARVRENASEFGRAAKLAVPLRRLLQKMMPAQFGVAVPAGELTACYRAALAADTVNARGARTLGLGKLGGVVGLSVGSASGPALVGLFQKPVGGYLFRQDVAPYILGPYPLTRLFSEAPLTEFVAQRDLLAPQGATHYELVSGIVATCPDGSDVKEFVDVRGITPVDYISPVGLSLGSNVSYIGNRVLEQFVFAAGVRFYQEVNGQYYPLTGGGAVIVAAM
jgi:hypothetical protein